MIQELHELGYSICELCNYAKIARASYYKWFNHSETLRDRENSIILGEIKKVYSEVKGIYGYRRITLNINRRLNSKYNYKRIYRFMKSINLSSVIRRKRKIYIKSTPKITAENILNREFTADRPNEKCSTDVTEFKLTNGKKAYLSAILDLGDNSIVSYVLGHPNNNPLVFDTLDKAIATNPTAKPIFHSDRGYQYTNRTFKSKLDTYEELEQAIDEYIDFYNTQRLQKKLKSMTPIEYRSHTLTA